MKSIRYGDGPVYRQPEVQVSWTTTALSAGRAGRNRSQIQTARRSLVAFSSPGTSLRQWWSSCSYSGRNAALMSAKSITQPVSAPGSPLTCSSIRNECPCMRPHLWPGGTFGSQCAASMVKLLKMSIAGFSAHARRSAMHAASKDAPAYVRMTGRARPPPCGIRPLTCRPRAAPPMTPEELLSKYGPRESMEYDVVVVGAGPAGLATAIRLKQLAAQAGRDVSVCVLEKGSEPGAHILSGAIMDPRALAELFPDWESRGAPLKQPVTRDEFLFLDEGKAKATPGFFLPDCFRNHGNYIVSLGAVTRWLAKQAEALGVEIFPGFAAAEVLYDDAGAVRGVATGNMGLGKDGQPTPEFQAGLELLATYTIFAEGARGHLGRQLIAKYRLDEGRDPQSYGIGIKELWQADPARHQPGLVVHTAGWPLDANTYGGSFLYHAEDGKIAVGFVVGLDYANPYLSPFEEFQRWKTHPAIR